MKKENHNWSGEYEKSYSGSSYNKEERSHDTGRKVESKPSVDQGRNVPPRTQSTPRQQSTQNQQSAPNPQDPQTAPTPERKSKFTLQHLFFIWLSITILWNGINWFLNTDPSERDAETEETTDYPWINDEEEVQDDLDEEVDENAVEDADENSQDDPEPVSNNDATNDDSDLPSLDALERINHAEASISACRKQIPIITRKGGENGFETWASIARIDISG